MGGGQAISQKTLFPQNKSTQNSFCPCFPGSIGCICCLLWFMVIYDDPMHHPCISTREKEYIVSSLAQQVQCTPAQISRTGVALTGEVPLDLFQCPCWWNISFQSSSPRRSVPIKAMVKCLPLWAIFSGFFSHFWLCTIIITYLPTYISTVLHVNIRDVSILLVLLWK